MKKLDWTVWKPRVLYGGFALAAFVLALRWTFPREAVKERLILEAGARGWQIEMASVGPGGLLGFSAEDVRLESAAGLSIALDEVTASLQVLPLLTGKRVLALDARLFDGRVHGTAALSGPVRDVALTIEGVDLGSAPPLRRATGLDLAGVLSGAVALAVPEDPAARASGRLDLTVTGAGINGGKVPLPGMELPVQKVSLGTVTAAVKLDAGKATAERLEARGGDAELTGDGLAVTLQPRLEHSPLFGRARLRLQPAFWQRSGMGAFQQLAEGALSFARGPDGAYGLQVLGSLGQPRVQPSPAPNAQ